MAVVSYTDIEKQIKKVPIDKLPEVYEIILSYSNNNKAEPEEKRREERLEKTSDLCGIISIDDLVEGERYKKMGFSLKTNFAGTVDEDLYSNKKMKDYETKNPC